VSDKRYERHTGKWGAYFHDAVSGEDMTLKDVENALNGLTELAKELCWYGHTIASGVPMVGSAAPAKRACDRWYDKTMRLLDKHQHSASRQQEWGGQAREEVSR